MPDPASSRAFALSVLPWAMAMALLYALDGRVDLANQALLLVLAAALSALWARPWASLLASAVAVMGFNYAFVPPRGSFTVDLGQHALLLSAMLAVSWIVTLLVARLRGHAARAHQAARRSDALRRLGDALRATDEPGAQAALLAAALAENGAASQVLWLAGSERALGDTAADEAAGLQLCMQSGRAMGPGTGRHEEQPAWYLPLRGQGAALVRPADTDEPQARLAQAQALCDQLGLVLERTAALRAAAAAREQAQAQAQHNTLLAAVAHDHRTPLATILGAASALLDQDDRLSPAQRRRLAARIADEAGQLARLTDNTLQLARLGTAGLALKRDWEAAEEIVGSVLGRLRQRDPAPLLKARVEPGLPLLYCDAVLMVQLLDNLVDNALKHGGAQAPVEILARRQGEQILLAVRDRGPGVPLGLRERIFEPFQRGDGGARGAGVGLALCRAIAQAHGGELRLRARGHGGASFELLLPVRPAPGGPA